jgi:hypothetical protein
MRGNDRVVEIVIDRVVEIVIAASSRSWSVAEIVDRRRDRLATRHLPPCTSFDLTPQRSERCFEFSTNDKARRSTRRFAWWVKITVRDRHSARRRYEALLES